MLFLEWEGKSVDDRAQNFQQLCNPIVTLGLVDEVEEDVVDASPDGSA